MRHRGLILAGAGTVLVAALLVWLLAFSSVFGVRTVSVHGTHQLSAEQVRKAADISSGTPLLRLDTAAVTRRVEHLPTVASASVQTSFPSTVVITVTERSAVGYVQSGAGYVLVDTSGYQFRTVHTEPKDLPLFVVPDGTDARTTGGAVAQVAAALPSSLLHKVVSIRATDPDAITLRLADHRVVHWGSPAHSATKARILPALLRQPGTQYDVSDPDLPFIR